MYLVFLILYKRLSICGYLINLISIGIACMGNFIIGGRGTSFFIWFNVIPILALATTTIKGFFICSALSFISIVFFNTYPIIPMYYLSSQDMYWMDWINYISSLALTVTVLIHISFETSEYEKELEYNNELLRQETEKYIYLSHFDTLTKLPNRYNFFLTLEGALKSDTFDSNISVFFMDLNKFKYINDNFGHQIGDILLIQSAKRLKTCFREEDFLARIGGDEFTAIVVHPPQDLIPMFLKQRVQDEFEKLFNINGYKISCNISIGLATYPLNAKSLQELILNADKSMYENKKRILNGNS
ncbi:GGDEF domain-containing protein [Fluoribacter gormanii]|uniref:GGDEF domain-containing protein n=1 Tax=Fluoribacter gormanii TaxID=464 RepID=UPI0013EF6DB6|nr:GGDEF domain-containing protein [Fluoribacter gormanii]